MAFISQRLSVWRSACRPISWGVRINVCPMRLAREQLLLQQLRDENLFPSTPVSTPRTTARNGRSVPDEHRPVFRTQKPASVMVLSASARLVSPLWFSYTRGRKNQPGNLNRDQATLEQALKPWAEETHGDSHRTFQQDGANWRVSGHTARATQKRREKHMSFLHHQGPVAPIIDRSETYWLHDEVCA